MTFDIFVLTSLPFCKAPTLRRTILMLEAGQCTSWIFGGTASSGRSVWTTYRILKRSNGSANFEHRANLQDLGALHLIPRCHKAWSSTGLLRCPKVFHGESTFHSLWKVRKRMREIRVACGKCPCDIHGGCPVGVWSQAKPTAQVKEEEKKELKEETEEKEEKRSKEEEEINEVAIADTEDSEDGDAVETHESLKEPKDGVEGACSTVNEDAKPQEKEVEE
ncbi:unnamed protein product, partial [Durusdinium trenchii]